MQHGSGSNPRCTSRDEIKRNEKNAMQQKQLSSPVRKTDETTQKKGVKWEIKTTGKKKDSTVNT